MSTRAIDIEPFVQQAATNFIGYLQVDTINPPGNESRESLTWAIAGPGWYAIRERRVCPGRGNLGQGYTPDADGNPASSCASPPYRCGSCQRRLLVS